MDYSAIYFLQQRCVPGVDIDRDVAKYRLKTPYGGLGGDSRSAGFRPRMAKLRPRVPACVCAHLRFQPSTLTLALNPMLGFTILAPQP